MSVTAGLIIGLLLPLLGTTLGAAMVFFLKSEMRPKLQKLLLGFAAGVMMAASVWSLLIPAIDMAENHGLPPFVPAALGFLAGVFFLLLLDSLVPHLHLNDDHPEGHPARGLKKSAMLMLAVTLHNFPEGMAVGVVLSGMLSGEAEISVAAALTLAVGIAIQNFPEGAIISMPLVGTGTSRKRAFGYGFLSGVVEPLGAGLTILLTAFLTPALPYILAFAAGAMIYVVVEELIPEAQTGEHSNACVLGAAFGFALMMILDVALG